MTSTAMQVSEGGSDFDFLFGRWTVRNRRLVRPLTGSDEWEEFEAKSYVRPIWSGRGHIEEWDAVTPRGEINAVSLHLYDATARQWRLYWATEKDARVGVATVGSFVGTVGHFFAQEEYAGRSILLRISWVVRDSSSCHWEQSFSTDGGGSWELNWTMEFTRAP
ncbi:MAG: hypothetical protein ABIY52_06665 [Gemmatimonadaceae bacterium]